MFQVDPSTFALIPKPQSYPPLALRLAPPSLRHQFYHPAICPHYVGTSIQQEGYSLCCSYDRCRTTQEYRCPIYVRRVRSLGLKPLQVKNTTRLLKFGVDEQLIMNRTRHPSTVGIAEHCRLCIEERKERSGTRYK